MNVCQEMRNLVRMSRGGIRVPEVVLLRNQVRYRHHYPFLFLILFPGAAHVIHR